MDIRKLDGDVVIATYDLPAPTSWHSNYEIIYELPPIKWAEFEQLNEHHEQRLKTYNKEVQPFWEYFSDGGDTTYNQLNSQIRNKLSGILEDLKKPHPLNLDRVTVKINHRIVDSEEHLRERYRNETGKEALDQSGDPTKEYKKWRMNNLQKHKFIQQALKKEMPARPKKVPEVDRWRNLTPLQAKHNEIVDKYSELRKSEDKLAEEFKEQYSVKAYRKNKPSQPFQDFIAQKREDLKKEIREEFPKVFPNNTDIQNGHPKILKKNPKKEGIVFEPNGRPLRFRWQVSRPLFSDKDMIFNPNYKNSSRKNTSKFTSLTSAFDTARGTRTKYLDRHFNRLQDSVYLVDIQNCFAPNAKKDGKLYWDESKPQARIGWSVEKGWILKGTAQRRPDAKGANTFQEILYDQYLPIYRSLLRYMTGKEEQELHKEYNEHLRKRYKKEEGKNPLDQNGERTTDFEDWRDDKKPMDDMGKPQESYLEWRTKHKGVKSKFDKWFKGIYNYHKDKLEKSFDDCLAFIRFSLSTNKKAYVRTLNSIGKQLDKNFLSKEMYEELNEMYEEYVELDRDVFSKHLGRKIKTRKKKYFNKIKNYPFAEIMDDLSLLRYARRYNDFVEVYNEKMRGKGSMKKIKGKGEKEMIKIARKRLNLSGWFYTIPNTHFRIEKDLKENSNAEQKRRDIEGKLYAVESKYNKELRSSNKAEEKILKKSEIEDLFNTKGEDKLIELYSDIIYKPYKYRSEDRYTYWIEQIAKKNNISLPSEKQIEQRKKQNIKKENKADTEILRKAKESEDIEKIKSQIPEEYYWDYVEKKKSKKESQYQKSKSKTEEKIKHQPKESSPKEKKSTESKEQEKEEQEKKKEEKKSPFGKPSRSITSKKE